MLDEKATLLGGYLFRVWSLECSKGPCKGAQEGGVEGVFKGLQTP